MKTLELNQMEVICGGDGIITEGPGGAVIDGIGIACIGVGLLAAAGSIFTFGASLAWGIAVGGAFCTGASIGATAYHLSN